MRVLIVNDLYGRSSAAGVAVNTARALSESGEDIHFLASVQVKNDAGVFDEKGLKVHRVYTPPYPVRFKAWKSLNNPPAVASLVDTVRNIKPDIVHFHNLHIHFSYACLKAVKRLETPVILTVHDVMPFCYQKMFCFLDKDIIPGADIDYKASLFKCLFCARFRFNPFRNISIRKIISSYADRVVAVSNPMKQALLQNRIPVHEVIYNGIDCDEWKPGMGLSSTFRKRFGLEGAKVVLYGGRLDHLKGALHLIRACASIVETIPELKLLIPGEGGEFKHEMEAEAEKCGIKDILVFTGWLDGDELKAAYETCDLVASPSLCFESFNLINLEGMAMEKPVVTSFFGGPSEIVVNGITGCHVNPLNESELADIIAGILRNPQKAVDMGKAGRKRVEKLFNIKNTANMTRKLYEILV